MKKLADEEGVQAVAECMNLLIETDPDIIAGWIRETIKNNPMPVKEVCSGSKKADKSLSFLVGQVIRLSRNRIQGEVIKEVLEIILQYDKIKSVLATRERVEKKPIVKRR